LPAFCGIASAIFQSEYLIDNQPKESSFSIFFWKNQKFQVSYCPNVWEILYTFAERINLTRCKNGKD
jgi:hypothetical protein